MCELTYGWQSGAILAVPALPETNLVFNRPVVKLAEDGAAVGNVFVYDRHHLRPDAVSLACHCSICSSSACQLSACVGAIVRVLFEEGSYINGVVTVVAQCFCRLG